MITSFGSGYKRQQTLIFNPQDGPMSSCLASNLKFEWFA